MKIITIIASSICLYLGVAQQTNAEQGNAPPVGDSHVGTFALLIENDTFTDIDNDSQYTSGILFAYAPAETVSGWQETLADSLPLLASGADVYSEYTLGQKLYTPDNVLSERIDPDDRPYAGWLYGGLALTGVSEDVSRAERSLERWEINLGVVGPAAGGEQSQKTVHTIWNGFEPMGWDNQLDNELGLAILYQKKWLYLLSSSTSAIQVDLSPNLGGSLGNVSTHLEAGLTLRIGSNLNNDYGPLALHSSSPTLLTYKSDQAFNWYIYTGVQTRAVARNIFLDGNTFSDSHSVEKETFVGDFGSGLVLTLDKYRMAFSYTLQSKEYITQTDDTEFASVAFSLAF